MSNIANPFQITADAPGGSVFRAPAKQSQSASSSNLFQSAVPTTTESDASAFGGKTAEDGSFGSGDVLKASTTFGTLSRSREGGAAESSKMASSKFGMHKSTVFGGSAKGKASGVGGGFTGILFGKSPATDGTRTPINGSGVEEETKQGRTVAFGTTRLDKRENLSTRKVAPQSMRRRSGAGANLAASSLIRGAVAAANKQNSTAVSGRRLQSRLRRTSGQNFLAPAVQKKNASIRASTYHLNGDKSDLLLSDEEGKRQRPDALAVASVLRPEELTRELRPLIGRIASTSQQKYELLEERDKIMRKGQPRLGTVDPTTVFVGVCSDMCPEKERYQREYQLRLNPDYEVESLSASNMPLVNHKFAVKDYSRSSADQECPLPHDLRPIAVLELTMDYLIGRIAVEPPEEEKLAGWYNFLWDRTRAIRKDVTQQMLSDERAVELMEKCARFHIFAAHRMCHMAVSEFDPRMNNENLAKCLQSLRHLYDDLYKANETCCPNESEFRAYDVVLNMEDTNILRQVLTYRQGVRQSDQIRFALSIFSAFQSNNYVRFFCLVEKQADFLQACILHRYFEQVRCVAIRIMSCSFQANSQMPVDYLVKVLGYETELEAVHSCRRYGLSHSTKDGRFILLQRAELSELLVEPGAELGAVVENGQRPSHKLVQSKLPLHWTLAQVLNGGGPSAEVALSEPAISFTENGVYDGRDPVIQHYLKLVPPPQAAVENKPARGMTQDEIDAAQHISQLSSQWLADATASICWTTFVDVVANQICEEFLFGGLIGEATAQLARKSVDLAKEQKRLDERLALVTLIETVAHEQNAELIDGVLDQQMREVIRREIASSRLLARQNLVRKLSAELAVELSETSAGHLTERICMDEFEKNVAKPLQRLESIRGRLWYMWLAQFVNRWREVVSHRRRRREILSDFPVSPNWSGPISGFPSAVSHRRLLLPIEMEKTLEEEVYDRCGLAGVETLGRMRRSSQLRTLRRCFGRWLAAVRWTRSRRTLHQHFGSAPSTEGITPVKRRRFSAPYFNLPLDKLENSRLNTSCFPQANLGAFEAVNEETASLCRREEEALSQRKEIVAVLNHLKHGLQQTSKEIEDDNECYRRILADQAAVVIR